MRTRFGGVLLGVVVVALVACGGDDVGVEISDTRVAAPTGPNAAMYFRATASGDDVLLGAETDVAGRIDMHVTVIGDDGTMGMHPVDSLEVTAEEDLILAPGESHLMLIEPDRFVEGDEISVTLIWEKAGEMTVDVPVVAPEDAMGDDG